MDDEKLVWLVRILWLDWLAPLEDDGLLEMVLVEVYGLVLMVVLNRELGAVMVVTLVEGSTMGMMLPAFTSLAARSGQRTVKKFLSSAGLKIL